ncbi:unnamed protein product, partial [Nezara viridula]
RGTSCTIRPSLEVSSCCGVSDLSGHHFWRNSTTIWITERRKSNGEREPYDLAQNSCVQDAFVIAVEAQARERLERLSALKRIKPVDMTKLSQQSHESFTTHNDMREELSSGEHHGLSFKWIDLKGLLLGSALRPQPPVNRKRTRWLTVITVLLQPLSNLSTSVAA